ncbi:MULTISPECIES: aspartyl-phosphate phosphatase Spo0E family protein [unclassified Clostridium]|uniref:aspartyl-phosphate phosphatase Spo0E family protein n=1 Tax=unclassified Clostridium TaxID=2614128 RepID=UPI0002980CB7|nr:MULTISPECIES: aspartyl-phosphate phosphatase Spo0E family protein [unclassified Clostridium]EKQ51591.1 MAG: Spo0E like sporulation regulatory protein [Clostridium sp. Maddingley MBC34-26]
MKAIEKLEIKIYKTRQALHETIDIKGDLLDVEVINISQKLDSILNEYNKLLKNENKT